jgi:hypothetical protein
MPSIEISLDIVVISSPFANFAIGVLILPSEYHCAFVNPALDPMEGLVPSILLEEKKITERAMSRMLATAPDAQLWQSQTEASGKGILKI